MKSYAKALPYNKSFVIPGFELSYPEGIFRAIDICDRPTDLWYSQFKETLIGAIGHRYLPVIQMSDGEFIFCVGHYPAIRGSEELLHKYILRQAKYFLKDSLTKKRNKKFRGGKDSKIPSGIYSPKECVTLRPLYAKYLKEIGRKGLLCLHFTYRNNQFAQQYFLPIIHWLTANHIKLESTNYFQKYFVYAFLNGPDRSQIFGQKRILIVTNCNEDKRKRITTNLRKEGSENIQFLQISKNRSMYDILDLSKVNLPVDVVLIGAGIGKPNIIQQLEKTNTLCIDAGFCIECLAYPEYRRSREGTRTYCWADFERNGDYTAI